MTGLAGLASRRPVCFTSGVARSQRMHPRLSSFGRGPLLAALLSGVVALGLGACGRRGQPEPPPDPSAKTSPGKTSPAKTSSAKPAAKARTARADAPDTDAVPSTSVTRPGAAVVNSDDDDTEVEDPNMGVSPQPTPGRRRGRAYKVPKEPFILDPLL